MLHGLLLLRKGLLRWRLETFGLYMPSLPDTRPWWRVNARALGLLLRQRRAYSRWLVEMHELQTHGDGGWWRANSGARLHALESYMLAENARPADDEQQG